MRASRLLAAAIALGALRSLPGAQGQLPPDETISVKLVTVEGEPPLLDVLAWGAPVFQVLSRVATTTGRELRIDAGKATLSASAPVDVHLRRRRIEEIVEWVAGAAGVRAELRAETIRLHEDSSTSIPAGDALRRAIAAWRAALARDPLQNDAPRLQFAIGNAHYQLGEFAAAITAWKDLELSASRWRVSRAEQPEPPEQPDGSSAPRQDLRAAELAAGFGDLPLVYLRTGYAHAALGEEAAAQDQWLLIAHEFPSHPLVADARLAATRSYRRQGDSLNANLMLRLVVETQGNLTAENYIEAGELLNDAGSFERAAAAIARGLEETTDPKLLERGSVAAARSASGQGDWHGVVCAVEKYVAEHGAGGHAVGMWMLLAQAHLALKDPFTALLAIRRARELDPTGEESVACDLLEGGLWGDCGLVARADPLLERAGTSDFPHIAAPALLARARLLEQDGQLEEAARACLRLKFLKGHEVEAAIALARICLKQRNRTRCMSLIREALPLADATQRTELHAIAELVFRYTPAGEALPELLEPSPDGVTPDRAKETLDGR